jgi:hypothetical protein
MVEFQSFDKDSKSRIKSQGADMTRFAWQKETDAV